MEPLLAQNPKSKQRLVACRECHRSKLKCDRSYPCKSCIKRGCADICPDGTLVATKRQKSAIEASQLREKTATMAERIRKLEEALATAHSNMSSEPHPLLIRTDDQVDRPVFETLGSCSQDNDVIDAFGTLSIAPDGRTKYHNQSAGADYFAEMESPDVPTAGARAFRNGGYLILPEEILYFASLFPFGTSDRETPTCSKEDILAFLPSPETAWNTCDMFFNHAGWLFDAISHAEFMEQVYSHVYNSSSIDAVSVDRLSLLFIVLALGTLLDLTRPYSIHATEPYFQLARAAFCLEPIIEAATIPIIQSLHLMIAYLYLTDRHSAEHRWLNMGLVAKLIFSSGLHRDSGNWIRDDTQETERRRKLFWEVYAYDAWITFIMGRPPSFALPHIQCKLPLDSNQIINENGQTEPSFHTLWKYQYRSQCLVPVVEEAFGAKSPSYATILRLDRKIRDFEIPSSLKVDIPPDPDSKNVSLGLSMQRYMLFCERETSLLYLHRSFFAQAVSDCPDNPLESKFAASVTATYRSACLIVAGTHDATVRHPDLAARLWFFWSNLFSAAIVLGSIVMRSPACQLAASAMGELDLACNLMEQRAAPGRSAKALPIVRRMRDKARAILLQLAQQGAVDKASPESKASSKEDEDELAMFAGRTRFLSNGPMRSRSPTNSPPTRPPVQEPRRRGSEGLLSHMRVRSLGRRGSEPFGIGGTTRSGDGDGYTLEYLGGAGDYVGIQQPPQSLTNASSSSPPVSHAQVMKSDGQLGFAWLDHAAQHSTPTLTPQVGSGVYGQFGNGPQDRASFDQSGLHAPILTAPASGGHPYAGEITGDGTWQQLMVQLGVMEASN